MKLESSKAENDEDKLIVEERSEIGNVSFQPATNLLNS